MRSRSARRAGTPSLRNVELTGPYFHNGPDGNDTTGLAPNLSNLDADIESLGLTTQENTDLVAFLKRPLTDDRVRWERGPFDHPELSVANGHLGNESGVIDLNLAACSACRACASRMSACRSHTRRDTLGR